MNRLEEEIVDILALSKYPMNVEHILDRSLITRHSSRMVASLLKLEEEHVIFFSPVQCLTKFDNRYGLVGIHRDFPWVA